MNKVYTSSLDLSAVIQLLDDGRYSQAISYLQEQLKSSDDNEFASTYLILLLIAYDRLNDLFPVYPDACKELVESTEKMKSISHTVSSIGVDILFEKVLKLANSSLIDSQFVAKQIGSSYLSRHEAALEIFLDINARIHPNTLFDASYYRAINELDAGVDAVIHYLEHGMAEKLPTHRLIDHEWLKEQAPGFDDHCCAIEFYWKKCYPKRVLPFDKCKVKTDDNVLKLFFLGANFPNLAQDADLFVRKKYSLNLFDNQYKGVISFFKSLGSLPRFIPMDFTPEGYLDLHRDIEKIYKDAPIDSLYHYLTHGIREGRPYSFSSFFSPKIKRAKKFDTSLISSVTNKKPLCVLMHLYYPDLWPELKKYIDNIDVEFDLHINMVDSTWCIDTILEIRRTYPESNIKVSVNEGRDIGGYISLLHEVNLDNYVGVVVMHSKKSQHISKNHMITWRTNLLNAILGSKEIVRNNISALLSDQKIGIIGASEHKETSLGENSELYDQLLDRFRISEENRDCEYVSGTMMMMRPEIMKVVFDKVKDMSFINADNKGLDFLVDGQLEHAIERVFGNVMKQLGYKFYWN